MPVGSARLFLAAAAVFAESGQTGARDELDEKNWRGQIEKSGADRPECFFVK